MELNELGAALARAQGKMENAKKDTANPFFKSKYADLAGVWDAIREPLSSEGLSVIQTPKEAPEGRVGLVTTLLHSSGQTYSTEFSMPVKDASNPQAVGSALTYARRYALMGLCGIAPEDDDGNSAAAKPPPRKSDTHTDWASLASDANARFKVSNSDSDRRLIYAEVRNSQMSEPLKTATLAAMSNTMKKEAK